MKARGSTSGMPSQSWYRTSTWNAGQVEPAIFDSGFGSSRGYDAALDLGTAPPPGAWRTPSPNFRNRETELAEVLDALLSPDGQRFWLIIAPPQLGKSWFLDKLRAKLDEEGLPDRWFARLVDVRTDPRIADDPDELVRQMLCQQPAGAVGPVRADDVAEEVIGRGKPHLCLLDSAELLDDRTIYALRQRIGEINSYVEKARSPDTRIALVVASRRDKPWGTVTPAPRLQPKRLTEFKVDVILAELKSLAVRMRRGHSDTELMEHATLVHRISEGLPALLADYIHWIEMARWVNLERLADRDQFERLARPYIDNELLCAGSLFGVASGQAAEFADAVRQTIRELSPYRLLTESHLSYHVGQGELRDRMDQLGRPIDDLWEAVLSTDLIDRPKVDIWGAISPPIRRLLFRYWYPSDASRAKLHESAATFIESFLGNQTGRDQCSFLVECLWHHAEVLSLSRASDREVTLLELTERLSVRLSRDASSRVSPGLPSERELRRFAADLMEKDTELAAAVGEDTVLGSMIDIIRHRAAGA